MEFVLLSYTQGALSPPPPPPPHLITFNSVFPTEIFKLLVTTICNGDGCISTDKILPRLPENTL